jgi:hypothetical protein
MDRWSFLKLPVPLRKEAAKKMSLSQLKALRDEIKFYEDMNAMEVKSGTVLFFPPRWFYSLIDFFYH